MSTAFVCAIAWIIDGDTFICGDGRHVRLAGIDAPEIHGCPPRRQCTAGDARASRRNLILIAKGRTATCSKVGKSYERTLAFCDVDGAELGCAQVTGGYAVRRYSFGPYVCETKVRTLRTK
jgi:micrococcal nuclease